MLEIRSFTKKYDGINKVVDNLNLNVVSGDIYGFIGHNGAGKTTTLKAIAGIIDYEGDIIIDGINLHENPLACKSKLAFIMDNPELYDFLTGIEYLNFIADVCAIGDERQARIKDFSTRLAIFDELGKKISSYSHGMKQKLALVSAFMRKPQLLLLDEPFVGLDPKASFILKTMMKEFTEQGGAIIFSTHILEIAQKLCNKVAIIKNGQLIVQGDLADVISDQSLEKTFLEVDDDE